MDRTDLANAFCEQLRSIAEWTDFTQISRVVITLGSCYGVSADAMADELDDRLDRDFAGTKLDGAVVSVTLVEPGQRYRAPRRDDMHDATGYEMLIADIQGVK
jgi:hypothetical protein